LSKETLQNKNRWNRPGKVLSPLRKSSLALTLGAAAMILLLLMFIHAYFQRQADVPTLTLLAREVKNLELTDLCLFTEARYARHLSQADRFSAFQDHPMALEHFPAGSMAGPPPALRRGSGQPD
jgi:hypothetical protein